MTKKDYKLLADWLQSYRVTACGMGEIILDCMTNHLCDLLENDNPRFNKHTFLQEYRKND